MREERVVLSANGNPLFEQRTDISPEEPFSYQVALPAGVREEDLTLTLFSAKGKQVISYTPLKPPQPSLPPIVKTPPVPQDIKTVEELYLTGLRLEQFYNPSIESDRYFEEALRRDPANDRVNSELGTLYCQRGMFTEAEACLRTALAHVTHDYTSPQDGAPFYYLGVALVAQGRYDEA